QGVPEDGKSEYRPFSRDRKENGRGLPMSGIARLAVVERRYVLTIAGSKNTVAVGVPDHVFAPTDVLQVFVRNFRERRSWTGLASGSPVPGPYIGILNLPGERDGPTTTNVRGPMTN